MLLRNYLLLTYKILLRRKIYTAVTLAGIVIPVTFIVLISTFFVNLNNHKPPQSKFHNVIYLDKVTMKKIKDDGSVNQSNNNPPTYSFIRNYVKQLRTPQKIGVISANLFTSPENAYHGDKIFSISYNYTDAVFWEITNFEFIKGRPYNNSEFENASPVIVVDEKTSESLFGTTNVIRKFLEFKNKNYRIIGVVKNVDVTMYRIASNVYLPYSCSETYSSDFMFSNLSRALILTKHTSDISKINDEFHKGLKQFSFENWGGMNYVEASFERDNFLKYLEALTFFTFHYYGHIDTKLILIAGLLFFFLIIIPTINLINVNINRVVERHSEIGVRKTFGASTNKLIVQFLFEHVIITFLGGLLSLLLSYLIIMLINYSDALSGIYMHLNLMSIIISLTTIFLLGIFSGLIPSINMARSNIVNSLSHTYSK